MVGLADELEAAIGRMRNFQALMEYIAKFHPAVLAEARAAIARDKATAEGAPNAHPE
jgi:hypothetical protein